MLIFIVATVLAVIGFLGTPIITFYLLSHAYHQTGPFADETPSLAELDGDGWDCPFDD